MTPEQPSGELTKILEEWRTGDVDAPRRLMPLVYRELRAIAGKFLSGERPDHTLQPTALVHEVYLRLIGARELELRDRVHFFSVAARSMRHILVDHARKCRYSKRGGGRRRVGLEEAEQLPGAAKTDLVEVDVALERLARIAPEKAALVELRFFAGLTIEEAADNLGCSVPTANRWWRFARAWMCRELGWRSRHVD